MPAKIINRGFSIRNRIGTSLDHATKPQGITGANATYMRGLDLEGDAFLKFEKLGQAQPSSRSEWREKKRKRITLAPNPFGRK